MKDETCDGQIAAASLLLGSLAFGQAPSARVRLVHASLDAPAVDIYSSLGLNQGCRSERQPFWRSQLYRRRRRLRRNQDARLSPSVVARLMGEN